MFVVNFSLDENTGTITADKTHAEILAAQQANKGIVGTLNNMVFSIQALVGTAFEFAMNAWEITSSTNIMYVTTIRVKNDNSVEIKNQMAYTLTPAT